MRLLWLLPNLIAVSVFAQDATAQAGCPAVSFSSVASAALLPTTSTHRVLVKQSDGSFTAFDLSNTLPYGILKVIPHFDKQLRPCVPSATGSNDSQVLAIAQIPSGGYMIASPAGPFPLQVDVTVFDSGFNMNGQVQLSNVFSEQFADLNGDGKLDIVAIVPVTEAQDAISVLLGNGGASFQPPIITQLSTVSAVSAFVLADVNGDHKLDLVAVTAFPSTISVLLGNGDGTFQPAKTVASAIQPTAVAIADLNGDGKPDLVFADVNNFTNPQNSFEPIAAVALGAGDGTFATSVQYSVAGMGPIAIADLNGDGIPDIVTGGVTILFGDGKGGFPNRHDVFFPPSSSWIVTDFNGDGIPDIVSGLGTSAVIAGDTVSVLFGLSGGTFALPPASLIPNYPAPDDGIAAMAAGDFNGDGIPDLVVADYSHVSVLKGMGDGSFQATFSTTAVGITAIAPGDFNGDGNLDFAIAENTPQTAGVEILLGNGDGTLQSPIRIPTQLGAAALAVGDFNGDGKLDLAVVISTQDFAASDSVQILLGNGSGSFSTAGTYPAGPAAVSIAAGDFNGDGKLDLAVANQGTRTQKNLDGSLALLTGNGDGTFAASVILATAEGSGLGPSGLAVADFNRDGKLDLALTFSNESSPSGGLAILLGGGGGTFQAPVVYSTRAPLVLSGDLNGDGIPDLVAGGTLDEAASYLLGNGDGSFQPPVPLAPVGAAFVLADLNRDGKLDIASAGLQGIDAFLNTSQPPPPITIVSAASLAAGPLALESLATAFGTNLPASGASVAVTDLTGATLSASVLYSSSSQVNFVIPAGLDAGPAIVTIGSTLSTPVVLTPFAPSLFVVNAEGLAAAYVTRVSPGGGVTNQLVFSVQNGVATPVPIDVSAAAGQAYLVLFGTGFGDLSLKQIGLNGGFFTVTYAGPQPSVPGLDQINILLSPTLAGSGITRLDPIGTNPVYIDIK
jgi:uncharacterized protein (TIGR03437 family)